MPESTLSVLVVVPKLTVGGTERHLLAVLPRLDRQRFQVEVATTRGPGRLDAAMREAGIPLHLPPALLPGKANALVAGPALLARFLARPPDIAHFFLPEAYLIGGLTSLVAGRTHRIMSRRNQNRYQQTRPLAARLEGWLHRRMDAIVGNSRVVMSELAMEGGPPERLTMIANGIETARFAPLGPGYAGREAARKRFGLGADSLAIVMLATLLPYKGHADVLTALARAAPRLPSRWRLLLAGRDDGIGAGLRDQAERLGLADQIDFLGEVAPTEVPELLAAADIGLLASHEEGFPNAALECMAAALPMLVTSAGGAAEVVEDGVSGRVVPAEAPAALAEALTELAGDPALRERLGAAGRRRVREHYSIERCVAEMEGLYEAVAAGRPVSSLAGAMQ